MDATTQSVADRYIKNLNEMANIFETATPANVDKSVQRMAMTAKELQSASIAEKNLQPAQQQAMKSDPVLKAKLRAAMNHLARAKEIFKAKLQNVSPEERDQLFKVVEIVTEVTKS